RRRGRPDLRQPRRLDDGTLADRGHRAAVLQDLQGPRAVEPRRPELRADRQHDLRAQRGLRDAGGGPRALAPRDRGLAGPPRLHGLERQGRRLHPPQRNRRPRPLVARAARAYAPARAEAPTTPFSAVAPEAGARSTVPSISPYGSSVAWKISWSFSRPNRDRSNTKRWLFVCETEETLC